MAIRHQLRQPLYTLEPYGGSCSQAVAQCYANASTCASLCGARLIGKKRPQERQTKKPLIIPPCDPLSLLCPKSL